MSATSHTPGPWYVSTKNPRRVIESGPRRATLAIVSAKGVTFGGEQAEAEANARLIAAAPKLLEALKLAYRHLNGGGDSLTPIEHAQAHALARKAIADAEGGEA